MREEILQGGNMSTVVRVGETVRREQKPSSEAVHELLLHLEAAGFDGAPRLLGVDDESREVLAYIEGAVGCAPYPLPAYMWSEATLVAAARLLRRYHDAVKSFVPSEDATWIYSHGRPGEGQLVCHNDIAPYNTVYCNEEPVAFIDWDLAGPADPLTEIAHALLYFVPICPDEDAEAAGVPHPRGRGGRLRMFCDAYGLQERGGLLDAMLQRQRDTIEGILGHASRGDPRFVRLVEEGHVDADRRMLRWLEVHFEDFARELA